MPAIGGWKIFSRNGGKPGLGGWFYNRGMRNFQSLYIVCRGMLTSLFYENTLPILLNSPSFQVLPPPPTISCHFQSAPPLLFLLSCFFGWMGDCATFDVLFYLIIIWILGMSSLVTLVPEVYWGLTHNMVFYWYYDLISHTLSHKYTQHTQEPKELHTHWNIYLHHLLCAHNSYLYNSLISKNYFPQYLSFSKIIHL